MWQCRAEQASTFNPWGILMVVLMVILMGVTAGCSAVGTGPDQPRSIDDRGERQSVRRAGQVPRLDLDGQSGFTLAEVVRIDSDVRHDYQLAVTLLEQGHLTEGIILLESVTDRAPDVIIPHIDLGVAYSRQGRNDLAEQSLQAALSLAPNHPAALNELGIVYRQGGNFEAARDSYERALAIHPGYHYALKNLGVLCDLYLEDLNCALQNYQLYAGIVADDAAVDIWIADLRNRLGMEQ
jgi:Flp pilus assembly protein TadD